MPKSNQSTSSTKSSLSNASKTSNVSRITTRSSKTSKPSKSKVITTRSSKKKALSHKDDEESLIDKKSKEKNLKSIKAKEAEEKKEQSIDALNKILNRTQVEKKTPCTHTSMEPCKSFKIESKDVQLFMRCYCNALFRGVKMTLTEKPLSCAPLRADLDFRQGQKKERVYTRSDLVKIVGFYQQRIREIVDEDIFEERMLYCIVLEKKKPSKKDDGEYGDGLHLHFPFFIVQPWVADKVIKPYVAEKMNVLWGQHEVFTTPVSKMIDEVATKTWMMYGSAKKLNKEAYLISFCVDTKGRMMIVGDEEENETGDDENEDVDKPVDETKGVSKENVKKCLSIIFEDELREKKQSVYYYLPELLSIRNCETATSLSQHIIETRQHFEKKPKKRTTVIRQRTDEEINRDVTFIRESGLMNMISDVRADNFDSWMQVGWALFNITEGRQDGLDMWIDFSRRSEKFKGEGEECDEKWADMQVRGMSIGTLKKFAKEDNPQRYAEMMKCDINHLIRISLSTSQPNETDVGEVVYLMYRDEFKCSGMKGDGTWYRFGHHIWKECDGGVTLLQYLTTDVIACYYNFRCSESQRQIEKQMLMATAEENDKRELQKEIEKIDGDLKQCARVIDQLKRTSFQGKVLKYLKTRFYDSSFEKKLDQNLEVFATANGVLDLALGVFRPGCPDDYCSKSCGFEYVQKKANDEDVYELNVKLRQVFPNKNIYNYFLDTNALCLRGRNIHKKVYAYLGERGNNGKSTIVRLMAATFGQYYAPIPKETLTKSNRVSSSAPRPELAQLNGVRIATAPEMTSNDSFDISMLKTFTGSDIQFVRNLHDRGGASAPTYSACFQGNRMPVPGSVTEVDQATLDRIRIINFESIFNDDAPEDSAEQMREKHFPADKVFIDTITQFKEAFLYILFERYKELKKNNLAIKEPSEVTVATDAYKMQSDIYKLFILERFCTPKESQTTDDDDDTIKEAPHVKVVDAFRQFEEYRKDNFPSTAKIGRHIFIAEISKRLRPGSYDAKKKKWYGYVFEEDEQEDEEVASKRDEIDRYLKEKNQKRASGSGK